ncbi:bifunctional homocysteine S-methyltransferase/methylenetetrahydrofolate reductase [Caldicellulosiruptoraceae bacterium PP1]
MLKDFSRLFEKGYVLFDGAMGTQLINYGFSTDLPLESANIKNPEIVEKIHKEYLDAGSDCIETNTFGANLYKLKKYGIEKSFEEINYKAVQIAKKCVNDDKFVFGSIGPLGKPVGEGFDISEDIAKNYIKRQLEVILQSGVDGIIFETMHSTKEAYIAINSLREIDSNIPYIVQFSFSKDFNTIYGEDIYNVVEFLKSIDSPYVGLNCGNGPMQTLEALKIFASILNDKIISVQPNAGYPQIVQGRIAYSIDVNYYASFAQDYLKYGAKIIGGCCGTTPNHIKEIKKRLSEISVTTEIETIISKEEVLITKDEPSDLSNKLGKKFVFSVEISPPKGIELEKLKEGVKLLKQAGADTVNIADSPMARVRISPIALAHILREEINIESILHFTCRDRNIISLQSELLGAAALGVKNVLALTGDPPSIGDHPNAKPVFDVNSEGLVLIMNKLNNGTDFMGNKIGKATNFTIGVALNLNAEDIKSEIKKLKNKIQNGANFIETQPIYDVNIIKRFFQYVDFDIPPILGGILPLRSYRHAEFLHNEVPGITIPDEIRQRMKEASDPIKEGIEIAYEIALSIKSFVQGIYIMPPFEKYEMAAEIIKRLI